MGYEKTVIEAPIDTKKVAYFSSRTIIFASLGKNFFCLHRDDQSTLPTFKLNLPVSEIRLTITSKGDVKYVKVSEETEILKS